MKSTRLVFLLGSACLVAFLLWIAVHPRIVQEAPSPTKAVESHDITYNEEEHNLANVTFSMYHRPPVARSVMDGPDLMVKQLQEVLQKRYSGKYSVTATCDRDNEFRITIVKGPNSPTFEVYIHGSYYRRCVRDFDVSSGVLEETVDAMADCTMQQPLEEVLRSGYDTTPCDLVVSQVYDEMERFLPSGFVRQGNANPIVGKRDITTE